MDWGGANSRFLGLVSVGAARSFDQTALRPSVIKRIRQIDVKYTCKVYLQNGNVYKKKEKKRRPLVARCLETIDVCIWRMFVFMSVVVTVWGSVGMFVV